MDNQWRTTKYLQSYQVSADSVYVFNLSKFKPLRIQSSHEESHLFYKKLKENDFTGLAEPAITLLKNHFIIVPSGVSEMPPEEVGESREQDKEEAATFTIRLETRITNIENVLASLKLVGDYLFARKGKFLKLNVKFICNSLLQTSFNSLVVKIAQYIFDHFPINQIVFYTDISLNYVVQHVQELARLIVPNMRFNIYIQDVVSPDNISAIDDLITRWGFCPNFVFVLQNTNINKIPENLMSLVRQWKDDFLYSFDIRYRMPAESMASYMINLPTDEQVDQLNKFIDENQEISIRQYTLFRLLEKKLFTYPNLRNCRKDFGQSVYIEGSGKLGGCFLESMRKPLTLKDPVKKNLENICSSVFSETACHECPLRYLCAGECSVLCGKNMKPDEGDKRAYSLRCRMRKWVLHHFLEDMTVPQIEKQSNGGRWYWYSKNGELKLVEQPV
jgi:hypothetical protein